MAKHLHIVTHDVPWPADHGGVIDLFYKIKALHSAGIKIKLHCFTGGRPEQRILTKYCETVNYYPRRKGLHGFSFNTPYIVQSRNNKELLTELLKDRHPILLEGVHCSFLLQHDQLKERKVFVRLHNVEYKYYHELARHEQNIIRRSYYKMESLLLKKYEKRLAKKGVFWAVNKEDVEVYKNELGADHIHFVPVFLPWDFVGSISGKGYYCLYHGNLSINENETAAIWLIQKVFKGLDIPLVIAGKAPSEKLKALAANSPGVKLICDPPDADMIALLDKAQINILPSFNSTGVKLKLLNALFNGRHCLVNEEAARGSGVEAECSIARSPDQFKTLIKKLFETGFTEENIRHRELALHEIYNTERNVMKLIAWIY